MTISSLNGYRSPRQSCPEKKIILLQISREILIGVPGHDSNLSFLRILILIVPRKRWKKNSVADPGSDFFHPISRILTVSIPDPSVADPNPGLDAPFWPLDPGWEKVSIRIRDEQLGSHFWEHSKIFFGVKLLKSFHEDPGSGMETVRMRDPGWNKVGSGIRDKHPESATLPDHHQRLSVF